MDCPPPCPKNFHVAKVYFLQHKNWLHKKVVIRATKPSQLATQHCCATSCTKKCCPFHWTLKRYTTITLSAINRDARASGIFCPAICGMLQGQPACPYNLLFSQPRVYVLGEAIRRGGLFVIQDREIRPARLAFCHVNA